MLKCCQKGQPKGNAATEEKSQMRQNIINAMVNNKCQEYKPKMLVVEKISILFIFNTPWCSLEIFSGQDLHDDLVVPHPTPIELDFQ